MDKLKEIYENMGNAHFEQDGMRAELDHFASMALVGLISSCSGPDDGWPDPEATALEAYDYAAHMMVERNKRRSFLDSSGKAGTA